MKIIAFVKKDRRGFTLVELMAVVVILGVLAAFAVPKVIGAVSDAKMKTDEANVKALEQAVERYYAKEGTYPGNMNELVTKGFMKSIPADPQGGSYNVTLSEDGKTATVNHGAHTS